MAERTLAPAGRTIKRQGIYRLVDNGHGNERGDMWVDGIETSDYTIEPFIIHDDIRAEDFLTYVDMNDEEARIMAADFGYGAAFDEEGI